MCTTSPSTGRRRIIGKTNRADPAEADKRTALTISLPICRYAAAHVVPCNLHRDRQGDRAKCPARAGAAWAGDQRSDDRAGTGSAGTRSGGPADWCWRSASGRGDVFPPSNGPAA